MTPEQRGSLVNPNQILTRLKSKEYTEMDARKVRQGQYPDVDWSTITPLDEELIERMRHAEGMFMNSISKYAITRDIPYKERQRQYYDHLRFWNHTLTTRKIDFVLMNHVPHQCYDYVIYMLCKLKGIKTLYLERNVTVDAIYLVEDWEEGATDMRDRLEQLKREYADPATPVPLSDNYEYYFNYYRTKQAPKPWYQLHQEDPGEQSFVQRWWKNALRLLLKNPLGFASALLSRKVWSHKLRQHHTLHFYNDHTREPDLTVPYVYVALHRQPEASTIPLAGVYVDQELIVQMLAACLPPDVRIYVKEHPMQTERWRTLEFYQKLLAVPNVSFVPKTTDTFDLIDKSLAVVSATGSAIFEAILRQKASLMFGHYFYQYGPGVYRIRTLEDCKRAVAAIPEGRQSHEVRDVRLFLKAIDESATPAMRIPGSPIEIYSDEEKCVMAGAYLEKRMWRMFPQLNH